MKTRVISALVASLVGVIILFFHNTIALPIAIAILIVAMIYELFKAEKCMQYNIIASVCFIFAIAYPFFDYIGANFVSYEDLNYYKILFSFICLIIIFASFIINKKEIPFDKICFMLTTTIFISFSMNTLLLIKNSDKENGLFFLILALLGAWLADSGAYFAGTLFGKHKLCPTISPKKTVEGLIGGTIVNGLLFILIGFIYTKIQTGIEINYIYLAVLGIVCSLLGLLGDLTASQIKRQCQIKDYGKIMPGHGGVLDRFDSVLFVAPFMYLALHFINLIK